MLEKIHEREKNRGRASAPRLFKLPNQSGEIVSSADFKGKKKLVVYFYPRALTPGCTVQACGIRDARADFAKLDTVVLGVSPDPQKRLQNFIEKKELNFDLLSDEDHAVAEKYGVWGPKKFMGRNFLGVRRWTFIIDKKGVVRHVIDKVKTKTHHAEVLAWIAANL